MRYRILLLTAACLVHATVAPAAEPTREDAVEALRQAVRFFHGRVAEHGGYVWRYSADLRYRQGEGLAYDERIWVQPPGTPAVGMAFLEAYEATGDPLHLRAARDAADALVQGQLHSGGWPYSITFDPEKRRETNYRRPPTRGRPDTRIDPKDPGGWDLWKQRRQKSNITLLDDDTTPAALRLLMRVDKALDFKDRDIHEAAQYGLTSLLRAQHPIGAWSHNYDHFPQRPPDVAHYPIKQASFPQTWSREWTKDFTGGYVINDRITLHAIETMLDAHEVYGRKEYLDCALRGGDFLLRAQMPEPQPAWAQQYDRNMHPVWDRAFEPPAITAFESQDVLETLLLLYQRTGQQRYLDAVPPALAYLRRSRLEDGNLARFYELQTNRPLYFTEDYRLTHDRGAMPDHYQFIVSSRIEAIALRYRILAHGGPKAEIPQPTTAELAQEVQRILAAMDDRGAWPEPGHVRDPQGRKVEPKDGILLSQTFIDNVRTLSAFVAKKP